MGTPPCVPRVETTQLDLQDGSLERIESTRHAGDGMHVLLGLTMVSKGFHLISEFRIVGHDGTTVAEGSQVLARVEAEAGAVAAVTDPPTLPARTVGLRRVLHQQQA